MTASRKVLFTSITVATMLATVGSAFAIWQAPGAGSAVAKATTMSDGPVPTVSKTGNDLTVNWAALTAADGYTVRRYATAGTTSSGGCAATAPATGCAEADVPDGTWQYTVTPTAGTMWAGSESGRSQAVTVDTTAPGATIASPGGTVTSTAWGAGCSPAGICGTATDATGVASVRVSVFRSATSRYWDGSSFAATGETFLSTTLSSPATASTTWKLPMAVPPDGSYVVHVQTTDTVGNATTGTTYAATSTFTVTTPGPAAPSTPDLVATSDSGDSPTDDITNDSTPTFTGTAPIGATVTVYSGTTSVGTAIASDGTYTVTATTLGNGSHSITAKASTSTGTSPSSGALSITVDTVAPTLTLTVSVNGNSGGGTISGTASRGARDHPLVHYAVCSGSTAPCTTPVLTRSVGISTTTGTWTDSYSLTKDRNYAVQARLSDSAGNMTTATRSFST